MKRLFISAALLCATSLSFAQSGQHRLGLAVGYGTQTYIGELSRNTDYRHDFVRYAAVANAGYRLSKSFEVGFFGSAGDFGFTPPPEIANAPASDTRECPGCVDKPGLGNLGARLVTGGLQIRYNFANGYLLQETSRLRPYVYVGAAMNKATDRMKMNCVKEGTYSSLNAGAGVQYYVTDRVSIGYQLAVGYFTRDDMDLMTHGANDITRQHNLMLGIDLF